MLSFLGLPFELLTEVSSHLSPSTILTYRTSCKTLEKASRKPFIDQFFDQGNATFNVLLEPTDLQALIDISKNRTLSPCIKTVYIHPDHFSYLQDLRNLDGRRPFKNFSEELREFCVQTYLDQRVHCKSKNAEMMLALALSRLQNCKAICIGWEERRKRSSLSVSRAARRVRRKMIEFGYDETEPYWHMFKRGVPFLEECLMTVGRATEAAKKQLRLEKFGIKCASPSRRTPVDGLRSPREADQFDLPLLTRIIQDWSDGMQLEFVLQDYKRQTAEEISHDCMLEWLVTTTGDQEEYSLPKVLKAASTLSCSLPYGVEDHLELRISQVFPRKSFQCLHVLELTDMSLSDSQISDFLACFLNPITTLCRLELKTICLDELECWHHLLMQLVSSTFSIYVWQARVLDRCRCVCVLDCTSTQPAKKCPKNWTAWKVIACEEEKMVSLALTPEYISTIHYHDEAYWEQL